MKTSDKGLKLIKEFEGCYLKAYKCPAGVTTIGYGHTGSDVKMGMTITKQKAEELLKKDLERFEKAVNKLQAKYNFNQNQFDALVSFAFNCGEGNLKKLTLNNTRTKTQIANSFEYFVYAAGVKLNGLVRRRKAEKKLFNTAVKTTTKTTKTKKSINTLAKEVIAGKWGNGADRKKRLTDAGYDYNAVQAEVNKLLK